MRFGFRKKQDPEPRRPSRQIWDRDPIRARLDEVTGMPADVLNPAPMPNSLEPTLDRDKTRVFDDELDPS